MITIRQLAYSYGEKKVLNNIALKLEEGHIYGLLGENGVGKTTLLTLLCGLKNTQSGEIEIDGHSPYKREASLLSMISYLPDEVIPQPFTAIEFAKDRGKYWPNFSIDTFTKIMGELENDSQMRMDTMSLGQLKKTYVSFSLACRAKYLFMDEPTNGLDIPSKALFRKALMKYTDEESTILISTHQVRDLENVIDPIIILDNQGVLLNASVQEVAEKLFFDYSSTAGADALYSDMTPGGYVQVYLNKEGQESKVHIEALFNTAHIHRDLIKRLFNK